MINKEKYISITCSVEYEKVVDLSNVDLKKHEASLVSSLCLYVLNFYTMTVLCLLVPFQNKPLQRVYLSFTPNVPNHFR